MDFAENLEPMCRTYYICTEKTENKVCICMSFAYSSDSKITLAFFSYDIYMHNVPME